MRMSVASCSVLPATDGTARLAGPVEMMAFTDDSGSTCVPSAGSVRMTSPDRDGVARLVGAVVDAGPPR